MDRSPPLRLLRREKVANNATSRSGANTHRNPSVCPGRATHILITPPPAHSRHRNAKSGKQGTCGSTAHDVGPPCRRVPGCAGPHARKEAKRSRNERQRHAKAIVARQTLLRQQGCWRCRDLGAPREKSNRGNTSKSELAPLRDTRVFTQRRWVGSRMIGPASPALLTLAPPALVLTNFATSPRDCDWRAVLQ